MEHKYVTMIHDSYIICGLFESTLAHIVQSTCGYTFILPSRMSWC